MFADGSHAWAASIGGSFALSRGGTAPNHQWGQVLSVRLNRIGGITIDLPYNAAKEKYDEDHKDEEIGAGGNIDLGGGHA